MPQPRQITSEKQLLVEGNDAVAFFVAFLKHLGVTDVQIQNFGGINELRAFLKALRNEPGFLAQVRSLGVIRDAETNPSGAFQSVCDALNAAGMPVPAKTEMVKDGDPNTSVLILPNATTSGMLESLCLESVATDLAIICVDHYFDCLRKQGVTLPSNITKARTHAYLSSKPKPDLLIGQAANAGYFPFSHQAFDHVKQFLLNL